MILKNSFPHFKQPDSKDCGPTCLRIISKYYGKIIPLSRIRQFSHTTRSGTSLFNLSDAADKIGLRSTGVKISYNQLVEYKPFPCIIHWEKNHFVVLYKARKNLLYISDPSKGLRQIPKEDFIKSWIGANASDEVEDGIVLMTTPTPSFHEFKWEKDKTYDFKYLLKYLYQFKRLFFQLVLGLLVGSILQFLFPFLTQSIVDVGIKNSNIDFIYLILIAQLMLYLGSLSVEIIRGWILLHISARLNIALVSDFFIKLMGLPISFFESKITGDLLQRINDHKRVQNLFTNSTLNTLFSLFNILVFGVILFIYSPTVFLIFLCGSSLYVGWVLFFLKQRKEIDYARFHERSEEQSKVIEMISGMQEIKLHNAEKLKRWSWEFSQIRLYKVSIRALRLEQFQGLGSKFIDQMKNLVVTIFSATLVINGDITLGMMLSIQYIIGQLNSPISQIVGFARSLQDAKISIERLGEIHLKDDEEKGEIIGFEDRRIQPINLFNVSFRYPSSETFIFNNLNLQFAAKKTTAIVGMSGSGKTTLLKLLTKFYDPNKGGLFLGKHPFDNISHKEWRNRIGVVMQEGHIFNDTIANNVALSEGDIDKERLFKAVSVSQIKEFIEELPLSYNTPIGNEGVGLSTGQKQRLLIARAVYKDPEYIFFDEATSSLDANNERAIMDNLQEYFAGRTAIVIAHRLSTVKNADNIIVLDKGSVVESGTHDELTQRKGAYYELVKNQLEL